jgi:DNA-directed RNA polymerase
VAADPLETFDRWKDFDDRFQFVAACQELVSARNNPQFITRLPVFLDGTANGIQHLACLTKDEESGELVNLLVLDERRDIYEEVAGRVKSRLNKATDEDASYWRAEDYKRLTRKMIKTPVMAFCYAISRKRIWENIREEYAKKHGKQEKPSTEQVVYLEKVIRETTQGLLPRPHKLMEYIQGLAKLQASRGRPLEWKTPSGLPIGNRYYEPNLKTVELTLSGRRVQHRVADGWKGDIRGDKASNAAAANFVHSMDSAHLVHTANVAAAEGIVDIAVLHDCYGALAPQVLRFQQLVRRELAAMYLIFDVLGDLRRGCEPVPANLQPPEPGKLDLEDIQKADYPYT